MKPPVQEAIQRANDAKAAYDDLAGAQSRTDEAHRCATAYTKTYAAFCQWQQRRAEAAVVITSALAPELL